MKLDHEQLFEKSSFKINEAALHKLKDQMDKYWEKIERANKLEHVFQDSGLAMEVNGQANFFEVMQSARSAIDGIEHLL
jgi:nitrogen-specific signal transduction histidine kinase